MIVSTKEHVTTKEVVTKVEVKEKRYVIELTEYEAEVLDDVLGRIGGNSKHRKALSAIYNGLHSHGLAYGFESSNLRAMKPHLKFVGDTRTSTDE